MDVREILTLALTFAYQEDTFPGRRLTSLIATLRLLACHWQEKAEEVVSHILGLPLASLDIGGGGHHDGRWVLLDMALIIRKHNLAWDNERRYRFLAHYGNPAGVTKHDL